VNCNGEISNPDATAIDENIVELVQQRLKAGKVRIPDGQDIGEFTVGMLLGLGALAIAAGALGGRLR
jgi:hypothetical protein